MFITRKRKLSNNFLTCNPHQNYRFHSVLRRPKHLGTDFGVLQWTVQWDRDIVSTERGEDTAATTVTTVTILPGLLREIYRPCRRKYHGRICHPKRGGDPEGMKIRDNQEQSGIENELRVAGKMENAIWMALLHLRA